MIGNRMLAKSFRISGCYWRAKRHQLEKIINNEANCAAIKTGVS